MNDYCYQDAKSGTEYDPHTCTDKDVEPRMSGATLRTAIKDGGDVTRCARRTLPIDPLGSGRLSNA